MRHVVYIVTFKINSNVIGEDYFTSECIIGVFSSIEKAQKCVETDMSMFISGEENMYKIEKGPYSVHLYRLHDENRPQGFYNSTYNIHYYIKAVEIDKTAYFGV